MTGTAVLDEPGIAHLSQGRRQVSRKARLARRVAFTSLGMGLLLLAFVAYQLWGTALYEHQAQARLQQELAASGIRQSHEPRAVSAAPTSEQGAAALVNKAAPTIPDPPVGQPVGLMSIPRIGMSGDAIVEGTGEGQLQQGPGHYPGTPLPGEAGNSAIAGHRTTYAAPFYNLNELQPGDLIYIQTSQGIFDYSVSYSETVSPTDTAVLDDTTVPQLTLTTCNPRYSSTQRLVVVALLQTAITSGSFASSASSASSTSRTSRTSRVASSSRPSGLENGAISGPSVRGEVGQAILWGVLTIALVVLARTGWRRLVGARAALVLGIGLILALACMLVCFQHVSLALPETF